MANVKACVDAVDELKLDGVAQMLRLPEEAKGSLAEQIQDWHGRKLAVPVQDYIQCVREADSAERNRVSDVRAVRRAEGKTDFAYDFDANYNQRNLPPAVKNCLVGKNVLSR